MEEQVKPLIWIESVIERHAHSRVEYMIKARSQFKRRSTANHVEVVVPVPADADSPKFKTSVGSVKYVPEQNVLIWSIKSFPVCPISAWCFVSHFFKSHFNGWRGNAVGGKWICQAFFLTFFHWTLQLSMASCWAFLPRWEVKRGCYVKGSHDDNNPLILIHSYS